MQQYTYAFFLIFISISLFGQGTTQVEFGKNRVQYHKDFDEWSMYESPNFITYWYGEARNIGEAAVVLSEYDFEEIQGLLEHRVNDKIEIIVYTDLTDLKQSNIGSEEAFINTGGQTKIVGNKIFIYFNGDHNNLRRQIREGVASVYLNDMLFGSNLQEIVQNAVMLNLPEWFKEGLVAYVGEDWNTELDNQLRDILMQEKYENFDELAEDYPQLAGHSLWYFIGQTFGRSTVSNLLYLTRINRSIESGFMYVLGSSYDKTLQSWKAYFTQRYLGEIRDMVDPQGQELKFKNKRNIPVTQVKISPNGQKVAYVTNEIGKYKIYIQDVFTGERQVIKKDGFRNSFQATDYNYPLLAWNPSGFELAIMYEHRDVIQLTRYDINTKKTVTEELSSNYHRVYSMEYTNPMTLVLSATVGGFSDIFLYFIATRQSQRITNDFYDDLDATFVQLGNEQGILWASNRPDTLLTPARMDSLPPIDRFDIFYYNLDRKTGEAVRVTRTPHADERQPMAVDTAYFAFLSDQNGIYNRQVGYLEDYIAFYEQVITLKEGDEIVLHADSTLQGLDTAAIDTIVIRPVIKQRAINHINTNFNRNIKEQSMASRQNRLAQLIVQNNKPLIFIDTLGVTPVIERVSTTIYQDQRSHQPRSINQVMPPIRTRQRPPRRVLEEIQEEQKQAEQQPENVPASETPASDTIDLDNYFFQSEFGNVEEPRRQAEREQQLPRPTPQEVMPEEITIISLPSLSNPVPATDVVMEEFPRVHKFRPGRIVPYRLKFRTDYVTTNLDNSLLFGGLNSVAGTPQDFGYPPPGILIKANFKDLFEDYEVEGGIRIPTSFNGAEYFLLFNDKKHRMDKQFALYRRNLRFTTENTPYGPRKLESQIILAQFALKYPLDIFRSVRARTTLRLDRNTQLATDSPTLNTPTNRGQRLGLGVEYVFDNTLDVALNIKNGTRYKIYAEAVKKFNLEFTDGVDLELNNGFMSIIGFDARHYQRLDKKSIFAVRLAGATSFGSEKILYYLGGVENWLFPNFNRDIPQPQGEEFAFQTVAPNLRGFPLNIRNGNSFVLLNNELRVPIFRYLSNRIRSPFFRNFQAVGFFDVGTAWQGDSPFNRENPLNTIIVEYPSVTVKVNYFRDPVVAGYGVGIRSVLFGYFIRVDHAWGIETRVVQDPRWYISLGMDF